MGDIGEVLRAELERLRAGKKRASEEMANFAEGIRRTRKALAVIEGRVGVRGGGTAAAVIEAMPKVFSRKEFVAEYIAEGGARASAPVALSRMKSEGSVVSVGRGMYRKVHAEGETIDG